ncbi:MAG: Eco57I restriction-modification methylase domain-containing protein, partial [Firmicutes bacterium]|nr:Eco57I restriction-modification methylase domain-containing protein [Bacillota bacterium]
LKAEHRRVFDFLHAINNDSMMFEEYSDNSILENNLYGVDINEESVEITKLSLWLHTAQKDRKLTTLNNKIKCGNSLIDDPSVAGEKAFNWEKEFPEVFEKGGFDVVIGNPPYVPTEFISDCDKNFYEKTYKSAYGRINIYPIFYEKGIELLKENGLLGFITPYTILKNQYYIEARKFILNETKIKTLVDFANIQVFRDATVDSIVFIMEKGKSENNSFKYINKIEDFSGRKFNEIEINQNDILNVPDYSFSNLGNSFNFEKLYEDIIEVKNIVDFKQGIITGSNKKFLTKESSEKCKKVLSGSDFNRYKLSWSGDYVIYDEQELHRPRKPEIFEKDEKILLRQTGSFPICMIDTNSFYTLDTVHNGSLINANFNLKYIMCLLNSNLLRFIYESSINETGKVFAQVKIIYIDPLPIKNISLEAQQPFIALADKMLSLNETLQKKSTNFLKVVKQTFALEKISTKLETFYNLDFDGFLKELKQKVTPKTKLEWLEVFEETKKSLQEIQTQIAATDKEINALVYKLYDLTEEEIKIVEGR